MRCIGARTSEQQELLLLLRQQQQAKPILDGALTGSVICSMLLLPKYLADRLKFAGPREGTTTIAYRMMVHIVDEKCRFGRIQNGQQQQQHTASSKNKKDTRNKLGKKEEEDSLVVNLAVRKDDRLGWKQLQSWQTAAGINENSMKLLTDRPKMHAN
eukprot:scaffold674_cov130-Amphora_coffeaeformis.AAC.6